MQLGLLGLGRMGGNMGKRLINGGHRLVVYDSNVESIDALENEGASTASSLVDLLGQLDRPRAVWSMVPSGIPTENTIKLLSNEMETGDIVIDGGNSYYKDSKSRSEMLAKKGIYFLDVGTSGGIWGLNNGYSLTVGGDKNAFNRLEPIFQTLALGPEQGYGYVGPSGAGHFVKMVHNGIEYGLMQAYAEGFELMSSKSEFCLDLSQITDIWRHGSVVRSWLLDLTAKALEEDPELDGFEAFVEDSGEGRWTLQAAIELAVPIPVIALSLQARFRSRQSRPFGPRLLSAMRNRFGGHSVKRRDQSD